MVASSPERTYFNERCFARLVRRAEVGPFPSATTHHQRGSVFSCGILQHSAPTTDATWMFMSGRAQHSAKGCSTATRCCTRGVRIFPPLAKGTNVNASISPSDICRSHSTGFERCCYSERMIGGSQLHAAAHCTRSTNTVAWLHAAIRDAAIGTLTDRGSDVRHIGD